LSLWVLPAQTAEYMEKTPFQLSRAFSPGVVTDGGKIVWVAGQTATRDKDEKDISGNFDAQVRQVFGQIDAILKRAGGSLANVVSMTVFIKEPRYGDRFVENAQGLFPQRQLSRERPHHGFQLRTPRHRDRNTGCWRH
jgi:2-iminobutanoate/2-iminopropanoate deaminase